MTKIESISFFLNCDLSRERANQIGKLLGAIRNASSLDALKREAEVIQNQLWKLECDIEEIARKRMEAAESEFQRGAAKADLVAMWDAIPEDERKELTKAFSQGMYEQAMGVA